MKNSEVNCRIVSDKMSQKEILVQKMIWKKVLPVICATTVALAGLSGCGSKPQTQPNVAKPEQTESSGAGQTTGKNPKPADNTASGNQTASVGEGEIIVFAAASLTETLNRIKELYETEHPEIKLTFNFDSSGTLKTQIAEGAACDLFISAGQKQMNELDDQVTGRVNLLENRVTLCVPESNPKNIQTFDDLKDALLAGDILFCMGNSDVPVGQYTQKIFAYYGLDEEALAKAGLITYGTNVKEVTTQVSEASVDAGVIYCTDAYSAGLTVMDYATAEMCGQVIYPAAVLKSAGNGEAAQYFLDYLATEEAMKVFGEVGFSPVG